MTTLDLRWLSAPEHEVAAAMATARRSERPRWVPTRRQLLVHVNNCLILWYLCIGFLTIGVRVDAEQDGEVRGPDVVALVIVLAVLAAWLAGTVWLHRWAARPPSPKARLHVWRQTLTALANGFEPRPSGVATFSSLISVPANQVREYPRFVAPGVEFGDLTGGVPRSRTWRYIVVRLPAPLPHLVLDATANDGVGSDLPVGVDRGQRLSLEGGFDRSFRVYSPAPYGKDALYLLTPDVMAALIDHAAGFNLEIVDDTLVFSAPAGPDFGPDFGRAEAWEAVHAVLTRVVPRLTVKAGRYLDERVPGQEVPRLLARLEAEREHPELPWIEPEPRIGPDGRRLALRTGASFALAVLGGIGWFALLTVLYAVPAIFAFAGFMSIVDGR